MSPPEHDGAAQAPKHRACDECRARKLACSKEADGCARCKREGMVCHYSPQKQMGRPRKRPRDETNDAAASVNHASKTPMLEVPPDTQDPGLAFLSFLTGGDLNLDFDPSLPLDLPDPPQHEKSDWTFGYTGNDFGQLNFDASAEHTPSYSTSNIDPALFGASNPPSEAAVPHLSSGQSSSPESNASPPSLGPANCACSSSLYLALDSMQKLPDDVTEAVRKARLATKTAYEVVNCPACSVPSDSLAPHAAVNPQAMHSFQLLMLLSTLIPSVVHAYERILHMVNQETAKAQAERREIPFTLAGYGGIWGPLGSDDACGTKEMLNNRMMEPNMWRLTVRALLRVDVYGLSECKDSGSEMFHLGLKDIVTQMENRSKARHAIMDPMIMAGTWEDQKCVLKMHKTGETPTCQRIIQIAKSSLDNLVIA
ncbi:uncharacterized protein JN550_008227 [Neoarthrinium moseri]|uniref:uncharacterized protein n=1 Tax=Neoarthrinium moseri TaxID=1658444 RepID=UPI001FDE0A1C|nr:uncharacterized protein JN550_008227 [Neoarthrinium moseri]KAI1865470.1 hypothetical protein JN550_008227 [Neoarthrinium moseri]